MHPISEVSGRQKSHISSSFCLLSSPRALNFDQPVDKNHTFPRFLSTFGTARPDFDQPVDKNHTFPRFLSTFEVARPEFRPAGRQNSHIFPVFCLLSRPRAHFCGSDVSCSMVRCRHLRIFQSIKKILAKQQGKKHYSFVKSNPR